MKIQVPEDVGGELKLLPAGMAKASLVKIMLGKSKANQPKATFRYTIVDEYAGASDESSVIGETVLETYSLQPQAIFKLNDVYKKVTGERLPMGDFDETEFISMLEESLCGTEWMLHLENEVPSDGSSTEERTVVKDKQLV